MKKAEAQRRADFESRQARLRRFRTIVGLLGFVPLAAQLLCGATVAADGPCAVPREIYLALWAAIFGTFLGLTLRLWRNKRAFERAGTALT